MRRTFLFVVAASVASLVVLAPGCGSSSGSDGNQDAGNVNGEGGPNACTGDALFVSAACDAAAFVCTPGSGTCANGKATACRPDGSGIDSFDCDGTQGMTCDPDGCHGACSPPTLGPSYVGCDYWPTVTLNPVWQGFDFAVAVGNASNADVHVTITRGATTVTTGTVAAGNLSVFKLPWVADLKGGDVDACQTPPDPGATRVSAGGAYRLRTDGPVTAYQLSPLEYQLDPAPASCPVATGCGGVSTDCLSYSNDASLLLPTNAFTSDYVALSWPSTKNRAAFIAVTATQDDTVVQLKSLGALVPGAGIDANGSGQVTLQRGDVLQVVARHDAASGFDADPSGTRVQASHPVQVIAGHSCANAPDATTGFCDHLEESMLPDETLGSDYLVAFPRSEVDDVSPNELRFAAVEPGTHLHFDPAVAPDTTLEPGTAPLQLLNVNQDVHVTADHPFMVAQYMPGSTALPTQVGSGIPSLSLAVPTAQFRSDYVFVASTTYFSNFVNVVTRPTDTVTIDGAAVPGSEFTAIGGSGYAVARHQLSQSSQVHTAHGTAPFGIVVYGYGKDTSYMYPGGLDLKRIAPSPIR